MTIDLRKYNWLVIEGRFDVLYECTRTYILFFKARKEHQDLVYFQVAIFAQFLA